MLVGLSERTLPLNESSVGQDEHSFRAFHPLGEHPRPLPLALALHLRLCLLNTPHFVMKRHVYNCSNLVPGKSSLTE